MPKNPDIKNQLRVTNIIYYSLITGLLLFLIVVMVFIQVNDLTAGKELDNIFTFLVPLFGLMMMFISRMIYNQMILKFDSTANLLQKISHYRTAKIVSWAMVEGACFFALVATMLTSNYLYIAVYIFLLGYFFLMRPSKESLVQDMRLNSVESDIILER